MFWKKLKERNVSFECCCGRKENFIIKFALCSSKSNEDVWLFTSLMKIYWREFCSFCIWIHGVVCSCPEGKGNKKPFDALRFHATRACICCIYFLSSSVWMSMKKKIRKWRLEVFAFIYGLILLAFRFSHAALFSLFNSFSACLHRLFLLHTSLKLFILILVVWNFLLSYGKQSWQEIWYTRVLNVRTFRSRFLPDPVTPLVVITTQHLKHCTLFCLLRNVSKMFSAGFAVD